jgi:hypothetical protein
MPISQKNLTRALVGIVIVLAFVAGYYESQAYTYQKRLKLLQSKYDTLQLRYNTVVAP